MTHALQVLKLKRLVYRQCLWQRHELGYHAGVMSQNSGRPTGLRCRHCGREVSETMHTRSSYRVDYYALHTGDVEPTTIQRGVDAAITVLKLLTQYEVVTCADCYRQAPIRRTRDDLFRPELGREAMRDATT